MNDCCFDRVEEEKEPCPGCGELAERVRNATVRSMVGERAGNRDYYLCLSSSCEVVYFQPGAGTTFRKSEVRVRV